MRNLTKKQIRAYIAKLKNDRNYHGWLVDDLTIHKPSATRLSKWIRQHKRKGFDETELWNLDMTIAKFILPRLKAFRKKHRGRPCDFKTGREWNKKLDDFIWALEVDTLAGKDPKKWREAEAKQQEIMQEFGKYFWGLWD